MRSEFNEAISEHNPLYKEGVSQDQFYKGAEWAWQHQQSKIDDLQKRVDALTLALDQIAYPIPHMQKEAELNGCELNGYWAVKMSEDHTYSKDIARKALEKEQALKGGSDASN